MLQLLSRVLCWGGCQTNSWHTWRPPMLLHSTRMQVSHGRAHSAGHNAAGRDRVVLKHLPAAAR